MGLSAPVPEQRINPPEPERETEDKWYAAFDQQWRQYQKKGAVVSVIIDVDAEDMAAVSYKDNDGGLVSGETAARLELLSLFESIW